MGYDVSLNKAWDQFKDREKDGPLPIKFFNDIYEVDFLKRTVFSLSCNIEAKDHYKILILHYIANESRVSDVKADDWISFKEIDGGEAYFPAFRKRAIEPLLRKYGDNPGAMLDCAKVLNVEAIDTGSAGIAIWAFPKVKIGIILWAKDEEFGAECNMLFNRSIKIVFPTEDIAVLGGIVASLV
ncbi:MAG: DUF3786 domain-containing protein [Candidatus Omnitrophota bacterium]|jgi:hypothetical protein|nr:DUF3786 domain-containing protein [Candidatus Omnitrophota bacterium]